MLTTQGPEIRNAELWKCIFGYSVGRNVKKSRNPWHPHVPSCTFMALMGLESTLNGAGKTDSTDSTLLKTLSVWGQYPAYCFLGKSHLITGHPSQYGNLLKDPLWFQRSPNRGAVQRLHSLCTTKKSQSKEIQGQAGLWAPPRSPPPAQILSTEFDLPAHKREGSCRLCMHHTSNARTGLPLLMQTFIPLVDLQP